MMKAPKKPFSTLSKGLYEPLLERAWEKLHSSTEDITRKYASRGFSIPPGAMYAEIRECYKACISIHAEIIFDSCCQAYKARTPKPESEEFSRELLEAITREQYRILASGEARFTQFNSQFMTHTFQTLLDQYNSEILSEGRRLLRYYSSKAIVFLGDSTDVVVPNQSTSNNSFHWSQRPIGNIGLTVIGGVLVLLVGYLIKQKFGLAL